MNSKDIYRKFCAEETTLPLFFQWWWLDAVCGEGNWNAAIVEKGGAIAAVMPYYIKRKYGFKLLHMPPLTSMLGPWIRPIEAKYERQIGYQKEIMIKLIEQLPDFDSFRQSWHYGVTNWAPFYWKGFHQSTGYTYVIEGIRDTKRVWNDFKKEVRTHIRSAEKRFRVVSTDSGGLDDIIHLNRAIFAWQGMKVPFEEDVLRRIDRACQERNCRNIFLVRDEEENLIAGLYLAWDNVSAHCLVGGRNPDQSSHGARAKIHWEAILFSARFVESYDFSGSMIESIATFCQAFGGTQKQLSTLSRTNSLFLATIAVCSNLHRLVTGKAVAGYRH